MIRRHGSSVIAHKVLSDRPEPQNPSNLNAYDPTRAEKALGLWFDIPQNEELGLTLTQLNVQKSLLYFRLQGPKNPTLNPKP